MGACVTLPEAIELVFDDADIYYMAVTFTTTELRCELSSAETKLFLQECFDDTIYAEKPFPWKDYADICREAIRWQRESKRTMLPEPSARADVRRRLNTDNIKSQSDIVVVIGRYVKLSKAGRIFRGLCPFHNEKNPSFNVDPERQTWHCFGACGTGGDVISFIMKAERTDFLGALEILNGG